MNGITALEVLQPLTEADRLDARDQAKRNVIRRAGEKPRRAEFQQHTTGKYTPVVTFSITGIMFALLIGAFAVSAMRLFHIGSGTFFETIQHGRAASVAGGAIVLMSEAGAVGFTLFAGLLGREKRREKAILYGAAMASVLLALVGNVQLALGAEWRGAITADPFAFLEAVLPSAVVLVAAYVLKHFLLDGMEQRQANERAYKEALAEWQARTADPESDPNWRAAYATSIREKLMQTNAKGRGRDERLEVMRGLAPEDWRELVMREIQADQWWHEPAAISQSSAAHAPAGVVISPLQCPTSPPAMLPAQA